MRPTVINDMNKEGGAAKAHAVEAMGLDEEVASKLGL